jgi:hypothetical protein
MNNNNNKKKSVYLASMSSYVQGAVSPKHKKEKQKNCTFISSIEDQCTAFVCLSFYLSDSSLPFFFPNFYFFTLSDIPCGLDSVHIFK